MKAALSWCLLGGLLVALLVASTTDRRSWGALVGDEATYLMQAESLAWDFDHSYTRADFDRFVGHWGFKPEGLILQSTDAGKTFGFGKPIFYPLYLAPFVRLSPTRGPGIANALLLSFAALVAARALQARIGASAPLWIAVCLFGSVTFAYILWAHADLFLMSLVAIALALTYGVELPRRAKAPSDLYEGPTTVPHWQVVARWGAVGALLAVVAMSRPFYGALFLPAFFAIPRARRALGGAALAAAAALFALLSIGFNVAEHGSWTSYGGQRLGFYSYTGFPLVDLPAGSWSQQVEKRGAGSWVADDKILPYRLETRRTAYNLLYLLAGRHVGLLPYYLPVLFALLLGSGREGRGWLLAAAALALAGFLIVRPLNFYGGGAAIANRYFLPIFPVFWFYIARPFHLGLVFLEALAAWPFLAALWQAPTAFPYNPNGTSRYVTSQARAWLPYETTQEHLKPSGKDDFIHHGLWIKPLGPEVAAVGGGEWMSARGERLEILIGSPRPLTALDLEGDASWPSRLDVGGAQIRPSVLLPSRGVVFRLDLSRPTARHSMWWTSDDVYLYRLVIRPARDASTRAFDARFKLGTGAPNPG